MNTRRRNFEDGQRHELDAFKKKLQLDYDLERGEVRREFEEKRKADEREFEELNE